jgi:anti-sigma factor RsiW
MQTELFESDLRSLMAPNHGIDIVSSNQHTVKPWFAGKLDFSPPVQDLSASGYPLLGGRRDYLGGRVVAALVYKRRQHWINLYIWPSDEESSPTTTSYRGYNIVHWSAKGMTDWAVSDLNGNELAQFGRLVEGER